MKLRYKFH